MKTCPKCGETKLADLFGKDKSRKDKRNVYCKACTKKSNLQAYHKLTQKQRDRRNYFKKRRRERLRPLWMKAIIGKFGEIKCSRCGFNESFSAIDFHHEDQSSREFYIGYLFDTVPNKKRLAELDKCSMLCSNCHRILHRDPDKF